MFSRFFSDADGVTGRHGDYFPHRGQRHALPLVHSNARQSKRQCRQNGDNVMLTCEGGHPGAMLISMVIMAGLCYVVISTFALSVWLALPVAIFGAYLLWAYYQLFIPLRFNQSTRTLYVGKQAYTDARFSFEVTRARHTGTKDQRRSDYDWQFLLYIEGKPSRVISLLPGLNDQQDGFDAVIDFAAQAGTTVLIGDRHFPFKPKTSHP